MVCIVAQATVTCGAREPSAVASVARRPVVKTSGRNSKGNRVQEGSTASAFIDKILHEIAEFLDTQTLCFLSASCLCHATATAVTRARLTCHHVSYSWMAMLYHLMAAEDTEHSSMRRHLNCAVMLATALRKTLRCHGEALLGVMVEIDHALEHVEGLREVHPPWLAVFVALDELALEDFFSQAEFFLASEEVQRERVSTLLAQRDHATLKKLASKYGLPSAGEKPDLIDHLFAKLFSTWPLKMSAFSVH